MSEFAAPQPDRAGLYVCGLLRGQERRDFEADMAADPVLAREVAAWQERMLPLSLAVTPVEPSETIWPEIARLVTPREMGREPGREPGRGASNRATSRRPGPSWLGWWNNLAVWRGIGAVAVAAVVALIVLRPQPGSSPQMVAVLSGKAGPVFTVAMRGNGAMSIAPVGTAKPPSGRVWQLWAVAGGEKPVAVGFVSPGPTSLPPNDLPADLRKPQILMAVTIEPPGGSPTGQPDTPIVFSGPLLPMNGF